MGKFSKDVIYPQINIEIQCDLSDLNKKTQRDFLMEFEMLIVNFVLNRMYTKIDETIVKNK